MTAAEIVLAVLLVAALAACGWLVLRRSALIAEAAGARAEARSAEEALARAEDRHADEAATLRAAGENLRAAHDEVRERLARVESTLEAERASIDRERASLGKWMESLDARSREAFARAAEEALSRKAEQFDRQTEDKRRLAAEEIGRLVAPIGETLQQTRAKLEEIERHRLESFAKLDESIGHSARASAALREDYNELLRALSQPTVRGRYGELQLRRVAELAGMSAYCDFDEQTHAVSAEGAPLRPDMVVRLPNERVVAVDAKCNTHAYVEAAGAKDRVEQERHLDRFAAHVADQAKKLGAKGYWSAFDGSPDFVVMFVPGDQFLDAALARRPDLLEHAARHDVILATPATLIALLRAVAVGWREHDLTERAKELFELGRELHDRAGVAFGHLGDLGSLLERASKKYNQAVGSVETRLMPTLRKFEESGVKGAKKLPELSEITTLPRGVGASQPGEG